jgi:hypothetical protein
VFIEFKKGRMISTDGFTHRSIEAGDKVEISDAWGKIYVSDGSAFEIAEPADDVETVISPKDQPLEMAVVTDLETKPITVSETSSNETSGDSRKSKRQPRKAEGSS